MPRLIRRLKKTPKSPKASSGQVRRRMQVTKRRDTPGEIELRSLLHRAGLRFRVDHSLPGTRRRPDVVFTKAKVAVFWDGCFWHGCRIHGTWPKANAAWWKAKLLGNRKRDRSTDLLLRRRGWLVLRFWEHEDPRLAAHQVVTAVSSRRG